MIYVYTKFGYLGEEAPNAKKMGELKKTATAERMCRGTPLEPLLTEAYSYKYDEEPDYSKLIFII